MAPFANPPIRVGLADRFLFAQVLSPLIERRSLPPLHLPAVLIGLGVALAVAVGGRALSATIPGLAATVLGVALGGFLAGKMGKVAGLYHGAAVGVGWIALEAFGVAPSSAGSSAEVVSDTVTVIAQDALYLVTASLGGLVARPERASSSGTGRRR